MEQILAALLNLYNLVFSSLSSKQTLLSGVSNPIGNVQAPVQCVYNMLNGSGVITATYRKIDTGINDWELIPKGQHTVQEDVTGVTYIGTKTANFNITQADLDLAKGSLGYFIDTTNAPITATLLGNVTLLTGKTRLAFIDVKENYDINNFTLITTPTKVHGDVSGYTSSIKKESISFIYSGVANGLLIETIV